MLVAFKVIARYQTLFCCIVLIWAFGIILGTLFVTTLSSISKLEQPYPDVHQILQKRTIINIKNPKGLRALKYCSPLITGNLDQEGLVKPGSYLEAVVVMTRHGDRGPMQEFRNLSNINCGLNTSDQTIYREYAQFMESLQSRTVRDAFRNFPLVPRENSCLPGQLTAWGVTQQLRTGQLLKNIYVNKWKLLSEGWKPEEVVAYSTKLERTYQSAISFLYGFLPSFDFAKLHLKVGLGPSFCYSQQFCHCPLAEKLHHLVEKDKFESVASHPAVQSLVDQLDSVLRIRKSYSSVPTRPDDVFDKLLVYICHQIPLPCSSENSCITLEQLNNIISFLEWRGKQLAKNPKVKLLSRLTMQGFLTDLVQKLSDVRSGRRKHRFILFSAHDNSLMPLMVTLGIYDGIRPPFSSRLTWELHSKPMTSDAGTDKKFYHLRVLYNGKDVTKRTSFCAHKKNETQQSGGSGANDNEYYCPLDNLVRFVKESYLKRLNVTSFRQACLLNLSQIDW